MTAAHTPFSNASVRRSHFQFSLHATRSSFLEQETMNFHSVKYLCHAFWSFSIHSMHKISYIRLQLQCKLDFGRTECINLRVSKAKNVQNSSGDVKTGKTSLSARINIWINPGFLMQSGALAIPSAECLLLDELSKPQRLKEINWNPPPSPFSPSAHSKSGQQHEMEAHSCVK